MLHAINPHQSALDQPFGQQRHLRLASLRAATPGLEEEAIGHRRQCREDLIEIAANVVRSAAVNPAIITFC
jgi:hypothetical protein